MEIKLIDITFIFLVQIANAQTWYSLNGYEYLVVYTPDVRSFAEAESGCAARNATVANVKTNEIQNFLVSKIDSNFLTGIPYSIFIGARRNSTTLAFQWTDGTSVDVPQWANGEPNRPEIERCVTMNWVGGFTGYKWFDVPCNYTARYICQRKIATTTILQITTEHTSTHHTMTSSITSTHDEQDEIKMTYQTSYNYTSTLQTNPGEQGDNFTDQGNNSLLIAVVTSVTGCFIVAIGIAIFCICWRRKRSKAQNNKRKHEYAEIGEVCHSKKATTYGNIANGKPANEMMKFEKDSNKTECQKEDGYAEINTAITNPASHTYNNVVNTNKPSHAYNNIEDLTEEDHAYYNIELRNKAKSTKNACENFETIHSSP